LPLLSASAIVTVAATATAAPVPSAATAATAAYFSAAGSAASMFPPLLLLFPLLPCHCFYFRHRRTITSISNAIATVVSATSAITDEKC
jgi:hypothetical protein